MGGTETRTQYFETYGQDGPNGVGTKAALIGWLLAEAITTMRALPATAWEEKTAQHPRRGEMTIAQIFDDFVIAHCEEHLAQAQGSLENLTS